MDNLNDIFKKIETLESKLQAFLVSHETSQEVLIPAREYMECYNALTNHFQSEHTKKMEDVVLNRFKTTVTGYIKGVILPILASAQGEDLLDKIFDTWENLKIYIHWMKKAFLWVDRYILSNHTNSEDPLVPVTLTNISYKIFTHEVEEMFQGKVFNVIYSFLDQERQREQVPQQKVQKAIDIYNVLCSNKFEVAMDENKRHIATGSRRKGRFYEKNFEKQLLERLRAYYKMKSQEWLALSVPEYLVTCKDALDFEEKQAIAYYERSKLKVLEVIEAEIVTEHIEKLIKNDSSGLFALLERKSYKDIHLLFKISQRGDPRNVQLLGRRFSEYIENVGSRISQEVKDPIDFSKRYFELKKNTDEVVADCFNGDIIFVHQRDSGFKLALNQYEKTAGYLAAYVDFQFIKELKGKTETEIEDTLSLFIKLFAYLYSRDAFLKIYSKLLAKRLINNLSCSFDTEKDMVKMLGTECGKAPVNKIDTMLNDVSISKEYQRQFGGKFVNNPLSPLVLTSGNWPALGEGDNAKIPKLLANYTNEFERFYKNLDPAYSSRLLKWILAEGKMEVVLTNNGQRTFLDVKTHQGLILLLFEKENTLTYEEISEQTGLRDNALAEYLKAMCSHAPSSVLKRENKMEQPFTLQEKISFNTEFKSAQKKVILHSLKMAKALKEKQESTDNEKAMKELEQERGFQLDALAVRVMKHRKALKFNSLIEEVIRMCLIFQPQIPLIKQRIEILIEKGYFMRDENDKALLIYVP